MNNGDTVVDKITGYAGIITGRAEYLHMGPECMVQAQTLDANGRPQDAIWFKESRLELSDGKRKQSD